MAEIVSPTLLSLPKEELPEILTIPCSTCTHAIWFGAPPQSSSAEAALRMPKYRAYCQLMHAIAPPGMWICDGQSHETRR